MTSVQAPNLLQESGLPLAYAAAGHVPLNSPAGPSGYEVSVRTIVRSLSVMQKEATVMSTRSATRWRLSSDEGPYLQGHDFAPAPLSHMTVGFATDVLASIRRALFGAGIPDDRLRLTFDARFSMEGSMRARTMTGGAQSPEVTVHLPHSDSSDVVEAVRSGVLASATAGLAHPALTSEFSLSSHGRQVEVGKVAATSEEMPGDPGSDAELPAVAVDTEPLIVKTMDVTDTSTDQGSSLQDEQSRGLHLRAHASRRGDGMTEVELQLNRPNGSTFTFLSDEPQAHGGQGRAPDSLTYMSAGLGFCFMTQIGRFAKIVKQDLGPYHIIQDTRFTLGDGDTPGRSAAPVTHVYLSPEGGEEGARDALDMSEQTCFLHALCRTELKPVVQVVSV